MGTVSFAFIELLQSQFCGFGEAASVRKTCAFLRQLGDFAVLQLQGGQFVNLISQ